MTDLEDAGTPGGRVLVRVAVCAAAPTGLTCLSAEECRALLAGVDALRGERDTARGRLAELVSPSRSGGWVRRARAQHDGAAVDHAGGDPGNNEVGDLRVTPDPEAGIPAEQLWPLRSGPPRSWLPDGGAPGGR